MTGANSSILKFKENFLKFIKITFNKFFSILGMILMPLSLIFFTIIVILYSKGYRIKNINISGIPLIRTGVVTVDSNVRGSRLFVNNVDKGNIPKVMTGMELGKYHIAVQKDGYYSYDTDVEIKEGLSYTIYSKLYFKPENIKGDYLIGSIDDIFMPQNGNKYIIVTTLRENKSVVIYKCVTGTTFWSNPSCTEFWDSEKVDFSLDFEDSLIFNNESIKLFPSKDNSKILVIADIGKEINSNFEKIENVKLLVNVDAAKNKYQLLENIPNDSDNFEWAENSQYLIFERKNELVSYKVDEGINTIVLGQWEKKDFWINVNGSVLYVKDRGLYRKDLNGSKEIVLIKNGTIFSKLFKKDNQEQVDNTSTLEFNIYNVKFFTVDGSGKLVIAHINDSIYVLNTEDLTYKLVTDECDITVCAFDSFSPDYGKIIIKNMDKYYIYWIEIEEWDYITQETLYELYDCSNVDCNVTWGDDSGVVFAWIQSGENKKLGDLWYTDLAGNNRNKIIERINSNYFIVDKSSKAFVFIPNNDKFDLKYVELK